MQKTVFFCLVVFLAGCATTPKQESLRIQDREAIEALKSVTGAVSGQEIDDKKLKDIAVEMRKDPEARSAVESVTQSLRGEKNIKYCPVDGKRFSGHLEICPEHKVRLEDLE